MPIGDIADKGQIIHVRTGDRGWHGLSFDFIRPPRQDEREGPVHPCYRMSIVLRGHTRVTYRFGRTSTDFVFKPAAFTGYTAGRHWDRASLTGQAEGLAFLLGPEAIPRGLFSEDLAETGLRTFPRAYDLGLLRIARCIEAEVAESCPSGRLYAEALSVALVSRLHALAQTRPAPKAGPGRRPLSPASARLVADFIDAHLDQDLGIATLAALTRMSASAFCAAFRETFAQTPHRYVTERRIRRSVALLQQGEALASVALECGFSTQSRFTEAFKRQMGDTPASFRRRLFPLGPAATALEQGATAASRGGAEESDSGARIG